ncbi:MAG: hypothetical protein ISS53_00425 [Dehalococcoidia bacterium]|nr:hypothetical protein [Dehalococcoidia bacterium]
MSGETELRTFIESLKKIDWNDVDMLVVCGAATPYQVCPGEYLDNAREDVRGDSERERTNALANAARAMACRMDELLYVCNLSSFASRERWRLPEKARVLWDTGIPAPPEVLRDLVSFKRNLMEHEYVRPPRQRDVRKAIQLVELFLRSTDESVENAIVYAEVLTEPRAAPMPKPGTRTKVDLRKRFRDKYGVLFDFDEQKALLMHCQSETGEKYYQTVDFRECQRATVQELMRQILKAAEEVQPKRETGGDWKETRHSVLRMM